MAYATTTPPAAITMRIGGAPVLWMYKAADAAATVDTSGYFTNGYDLGMRDGDLLFVYNTATKIWSSHTVTGTGTTIDVADGTTIGSSTNTD